MSQTYIDGATLDEALDAHRQGIPIARLAERLGIEPDDLRRRLGLPAPQTEPQTDDFDLWSVDRLDELL